MRALVIGGTKGFGYEVSVNLSKKGYEVITIGRSDNADFRCDISNSGQLDETLELVKSKSPRLDFLAFIVGFAKAVPESKLTSEFRRLVYRSNLEYVEQAFEKLEENLLRSSDPRAITIGTLWSYRNKCKELLPYIESKRDLSELTREISITNPALRINMYCIPTMNTPGYDGVFDSFKQLGKSKELEDIQKANPKLIAKSLVESATSTIGSGDTFSIDLEGKLQKLTKSNK